MIQREDVETGLFAASVAGLAMLTTMARGIDPDQVLLAGAIAGCCVPVYVYGSQPAVSTASAVRPMANCDRMRIGSP